MTTFKIITLAFSALFALVWTYLSIVSQAMYQPPGEISAFMIALITGKIFQGHLEAKQ